MNQGTFFFGIIFGLAFFSTCNAFTASLDLTGRQTGAWEACKNVRGVCIDTNSYSCTGSTLTGYCPGASNIRCCPFPSGVNSGSCVSEGVGVCTRTENCLPAGSAITGKCPGPYTVTCCPSRTTNTGSTYLPPPPSTARSYGKCVTKYSKFSGDCIPVADCTGGTFMQLCPGSSDINCCVTETRSTSAVPSNPIISLTTFQQLFPLISSSRASALYPYFISSLSIASINTCNKVAAYAAQISHETAGLRRMEEYSDGSSYEGRLGLGNTQTGDGRRFIGRGSLHLTGRYNYNFFGQKANRPYESVPESVAMPSDGFLAGAWYWSARVKSSDADAGTQAGFDQTTIAINGCGSISSCNGVSERRNLWSKNKQILRC